MSYFEYVAGSVLEGEGYGFYALIHAAMRKADTANTVKLKNAFPEVYKELQERYDLPGGKYPNEL